MNIISPAAFIACALGGAKELSANENMVETAQH